MSVRDECGSAVLASGTLASLVNLVTIIITVAMNSMVDIIIGIVIVILITVH